MFAVLQVSKRVWGRPIQRLSQLSEVANSVGQIKWCPVRQMSSCLQRFTVGSAKLTKITTKLQTMSWYLHNFHQVKAAEHEIWCFHSRVGEGSGLVGCYGLSSGKQNGRFGVAYCLQLQPTRRNSAEDLSIHLAEESVGQARDTE